MFLNGRCAVPDHGNIYHRTIDGATFSCIHRTIEFVSTIAGYAGAASGFCYSPPRNAITAPTDSSGFSRYTRCPLPGMTTFLLFRIPAE